MFVEEKRHGETPVKSPQLADLIYALRNPQLWPQGFKWEYWDCERCAMGLAYRMGAIDLPYFVTFADAYDLDGQKRHKARNVLCVGNRFLGIPGLNRTRPEQLADALEKLL